MAKKKNHSFKKIGVGSWALALTMLIVAILRPSDIGIGIAYSQSAIIIATGLAVFAIVHNFRSKVLRAIGYLSAFIVALTGGVFGYSAWYLITNYSSEFTLIDFYNFAQRIDISFYSMIAISLLFIYLVQVRFLLVSEVTEAEDYDTSRLVDSDKSIDRLPEAELFKGLDRR